MPRLPDPVLEEKILDAAQKLWRKGEECLTMRAVAREAGTNTPAVYRRFRDRDDIIRSLLRRMRLDLASLMLEAPTPEEGADRYLDYALSHPHEYEQFYRYNYALDHSTRSKRVEMKASRPARHAMQQKLSEKFGGSPRDYEKLVMALWMLAHGAAMLLITKSILPEDAQTARSVFTRSIRILLRS